MNLKEFDELTIYDLETTSGLFDDIRSSIELAENLPKIIDQKLQSLLSVRERIGLYSDLRTPFSKILEELKEEFEREYKQVVYWAHGGRGSSYPDYSIKDVLKNTLEEYIEDDCEEWAHNRYGHQDTLYYGFHDLSEFEWREAIVRKIHRNQWNKEISTIHFSVPSWEIPKKYKRMKCSYASSILDKEFIPSLKVGTKFLVKINPNIKDPYYQVYMASKTLDSKYEKTLR